MKIAISTLYIETCHFVWRLNRTTGIPCRKYKYPLIIQKHPQTGSPRAGSRTQMQRPGISSLQPNDHSTLI